MRRKLSFEAGFSSSSFSGTRMLYKGLFFLSFLSTVSGQPPAWYDQVLDGDMLYTADEHSLPSTHLPAIANGYLGMQIGGDTVYVSGVYSGKAKDEKTPPSHRAKIANPAALTHGATALHCGLDLVNAVYKKRSYIAPALGLTASAAANTLGVLTGEIPAIITPTPETATTADPSPSPEAQVFENLPVHDAIRAYLSTSAQEALGSGMQPSGLNDRKVCMPAFPGLLETSCTPRPDRVWVEQRWYAHRVLKHLLVTEIEVLGGEAEVTTGRPLDSHSDRHGEVHAHDHSAHGHYTPPGVGDYVEVDLEGEGESINNNNNENSSGDRRRKAHGGSGGGRDNAEAGNNNGRRTRGRRGSRSGNSNVKGGRGIADRKTDGEEGDTDDDDSLLGRVRASGLLPQCVKLQPIVKYASLREQLLSSNLYSSSPSSSSFSSSSTSSSSPPKYAGANGKLPHTLAMLKLEPARVAGGALGTTATATDNSDIDFLDVTAATCALATAEGATLETKAALRGCTGAHGLGREWSVKAGYVREMEMPSLEHTAVVVLTSSLPAEQVLAVSKEGVTFPYYTIIVTSLDFPSGTSISTMAEWAARHYEVAVALASKGALFALHATAWREGLWQSGVEVEGKFEVASTTRASQYSLLSLVRADWPFGLSPGGLSTNGFLGHHFWDVDSFIWPPLNLLHQDLASSLLLYRYYRLPGAREKARSYSPPYEGTMFPWESGFAGVETTPSWAPMGQHEIHVSGDVAVAVWQHYQATRDGAWLRDIGYPILSGVADFWLSRALQDTPGAVVEGGNGKEYWSRPHPHFPNLPNLQTNPPTSWPLHISKVIAATEFYSNVTDNTFTNGVAKLALLHASHAAKALGYGEGVWKRWETAAGRIIIPFDSKSLRHPYFEGYDWTKPVQLLDVPLLHTVLGLDVQRDVAVADTKHYLKMFEGGAAFSYAVNTIAAADIGLSSVANSFFTRAYATFVNGPFRVWTEYPDGTGCPNFVTGAGGFIQALIAGYLGARLKDGGLELEPSLPDGVSKLRVKSISLAGHRFSVEFDGTLVKISAENPAAGSGEWERRLLRAGRLLAADQAEVDSTLRHHIVGTVVAGVAGNGDVGGGGTSSGFRKSSASGNSNNNNNNNGNSGNTNSGFFSRFWPWWNGDKEAAEAQAAAASRRIYDAPPWDSAAYFSSASSFPLGSGEEGYNESSIDGDGGSGVFSPSLYDPADPKMTPADMVTFRPWLSAGSHLARSSTGGNAHVEEKKSNNKANEGFSFTQEMIVVRDGRGRETYLKAGESISLGAQKVFVTVKEKNNNGDAKPQG